MQYMIEQEDIRWAVKILEGYIFIPEKDIPQHMRDKALFIFKEWKKQPHYRSVFSTYIPKNIRIQRYSNCI